MIYTLYSYENVIELLYDSGVLSCQCKITDNRPMHNQTVQIYKGVDNQVKFRVFNPDRKLVNIHQLSVFASFINTENKERVLVKQCSVSEESNGVFVLSVLEGDLLNVPTGYYNLVITGQENFIPGISNIEGMEVVSTPFYTNTSGSVTLYAEVKDDAEKAPIETHVATQWRSIPIPNMTNSWNYAGPFPANRVKNYRSSLHTIAIYAENFSGKLEVLGTLDQIPSMDDNDGSWFTVSLRSLHDYAKFDNFTGISPYTFQANILWLKFRWMPDITVPGNGTITQIMLRS